MGVESPWDMRPRDMRERLNGAKSLPIDRIYFFVEEGQLLDGADSTPLAAAWNVASADRFSCGG